MKLKSGAIGQVWNRFSFDLTEHPSPALLLYTDSCQLLAPGPTRSLKGCLSRARIRCLQADEILKALHALFCRRFVFAAGQEPQDGKAGGQDVRESAANLFLPFERRVSEG